MEQGGAEDFTGSSAGEDIPRLTAAADFSEMISGLDIWGYYNQYYLLEFLDHSYILVQIPQAEADAIAKGESITLPIWQKAGMTDTARSRHPALVRVGRGADAGRRENI